MLNPSRSDRSISTSHMHAEGSAVRTCSGIFASPIDLSVPPATGSFLTSAAAGPRTMRPGTPLVSANGRFQFFVEGDCRFAIYRGAPSPSSVVWEAPIGSATCSHPTLSVTADGSIAVSSGASVPWRSGPGGRTDGPFYFVLDNSGVATLATSAGTVLWSTAPPHVAWTGGLPCVAPAPPTTTTTTTTAPPTTTAASEETSVEPASDRTAPPATGSGPDPTTAPGASSSATTATGGNAAGQSTTTSAHSVTESSTTSVPILNGGNNGITEASSSRGGAAGPAIIGGVVAGVLLLAIVVLLLAIRHRRKRAREAARAVAPNALTNAAAATAAAAGPAGRKGLRPVSMRMGATFSNPMYSSPIFLPGDGAGEDATQYADFVPLSGGAAAGRAIDGDATGQYMDAVGSPMYFHATDHGVDYAVPVVGSTAEPGAGSYLDTKPREGSGYLDVKPRDGGYAAVNGFEPSQFEKLGANGERGVRAPDALARESHTEAHSSSFQPPQYVSLAEQSAPSSDVYDPASLANGYYADLNGLGLGGAGGMGETPYDFGFTEPVQMYAGLPNESLYSTPNLGAGPSAGMYAELPSASAGRS
jgi:hypothetical protein